MAVAFDAATTGTAAGAGSLTFSHTVGAAGADRLLIVAVSIDNRTVTGVTYGGTAMTSVGSATNGAQVSHMWRLIAPATGANNVVITLSGGGSDIVATATSYTGVDQTTPLGTAATATGTSTAVSVAVTSVANDLVVDSVTSNLPTLTVDASQTQRGNATAGDNQGASSTEVAAGTSTTMSWTISASSAWATVGAAIKPVAEVNIDFSSATTDGADVAAGSISVVVGVSSATTDGADVLLANIEVVSNNIDFSSATTDGADVAAGSISVVVGVSSATTDGADVAAGSISVVVGVSSATTDGADVLLANIEVVVPATIARPSADTTAGAWLPSTGTSLFTMIDEVIADDTDYIFATTNTTSVLALSAVVDPLTSTGQVIEYRAWSPLSNGLTVRLKQGAVTIATWIHATLPTVPTAYQQILTPAECDAITNYSTLSIEFQST